MKAGIVRRLYFVYWASVERSDWKNAWTNELIYELTYNDAIRLPLRDDLDWKFANCNRKSESYAANKYMVDMLRGHKIRRCPLIYVELWEKGLEQTKEEYWVIDSDNEYRMKFYLNRLVKYLNTPHK